MSDAGARSDIEREFEEAKETARAYLRAVRVIGPDAIPKTEYREREKKIMRDTILSGWTADAMMPTDDSAYRATRLAFQYMHCGRDAEILDALLERDCSHPAYRLALELVVCGLLATGGDVPERLRRWDDRAAEIESAGEGKVATGAGSELANRDGRRDDGHGDERSGPLREKPKDAAASTTRFAGGARGGRQTDRGAVHRG